MMSTSRRSLLRSRQAVLGVPIGEVDLGAADEQAKLGVSVAGFAALVDVNFQVADRTLTFTASIKIPVEGTRTIALIHKF
jgi:hypothetical protein